MALEKDVLLFNIIELEGIPAFCKVYLYTKQTEKNSGHTKRNNYPSNSNSLFEAAERMVKEIVETKSDYRIISVVSGQIWNGVQCKEGITGKYEDNGYETLVRRLNDEEMADLGRMLIGKIEQEKHFRSRGGD
jgi:hypothetical protein